jgi:methyl-accepting chemotaxis protein
MMPDSLKKYAKGTEKAVRATALLATATAGLKNGLEATKGAFNLIGGAMTGVLSIAKGTVGLVTNIIGGFFGAAADLYQQMAGAINDAKEAIRGAYGDLEGPIGGMVLGLKNELGEASGALASAGTDLYHVIGDAAERIQYAKEIADGFGDVLVRVKDQVQGNVASMMLLSKGMGVSADAMKVMAIDAEARGESMEESLGKTAQASAYMAKSFGIDVKQIGKGFNAMMESTEQFGDLAPEVMVATAAYATKLGVTIQDLQGIMGKFDEFEAAAQSAGMLAEAFGMNVDAMNMMMAENPAERIDMIRKAFEDTGRSVEDLNRRELKLMADQAGLDVDSMKNALSMSVDEMGFDDFEDAMGEAQEQMSVEESMQSMAKSIQKMTKELADLGKGPLSSFLNGFMRGIEMSKEYRELLGGLSDYLKVFFKWGQKVGAEFAHWAHSMGATAKNIKEFLNFQGVDKMFNKLKAAFKEFSANMMDDPAKAGRELIEKIWAGITGYIDNVGASAIGSKFSGMVAGFIESIGGMVPALIEKVSSMIKTVADFISGNGVQSTIGDAAQSGIGSALGNAFSSIFTSLKDTLAPALMELFGALFEQVKEPLIKLLAGIWGFILFKTLATALAQQAIISLVRGGMGKIFGAASTGTAATQAAGAMGGGNPATAANAGATLTSLVTSMTALTAPQIADFGAKVFSLAMTTMKPLALYAAGAAIVALAYKKMGIGIMDVLAAFTGIGLSLGMTAGLAYTANTIQPSAVSSASKGIGAAFLLNIALAAYGLGLDLMMKAIPSPDPGKVVELYTALGISLMASLGIGYAAMTVGLNLTGPQVAAIGYGFLAAMGMLVVVGVYSLALNAMLAVAGVPDVLKVTELYASLAISLGATIGVVLAGAALGPLALLIPVAAIGMAATMAFMHYSVIPFTNFILDELTTIKFDVKAVDHALDGMEKTIMAAAAMIAATAAMGALAMIPGAVPILLAGIVAMYTFSRTSFPMIFSLMRDINDLDIGPDPKIFEVKIDAVGKLIKAIQGLGSLGLEAGKISSVSGLFGSSAPSADAIKSMSGFISAIIDDVKSLIVDIVDMTKGMSGRSLQGVAAIAEVIASIAEFGAAMMAPLQQVQENASFWTSSKSLAKNTSSLTSGLTNIMSSLKTNMGPLINDIVDIINGITFPKGFKEKTSALSGAFDVITKISTAVQSFYDMGKEDIGMFDFSSSADDQLSRIFLSARGFFQSGYLESTVNAAVVSLSNMSSLSETQVNNLKSVDSLIDIVKKLSNFGTFLSETGLEGLQNLNVTWKLMDVANLHVSDFITDIKEEVGQIASNLESMQVELNDINLKPIVGGILKATGKNEITIKPGNVHMHVNFNVSMDAKELATALHTSNEKDLPNGYFVLTEEAKGDNGIGSIH